MCAFTCTGDLKSQFLYQFTPLVHLNGRQPYLYNCPSPSRAQIQVHLILILIIYVAL